MILRALISTAAAAVVACTLPLAAAAQQVDEIVRLDVLPGWRTADGAHVAALHLTLAPGWKTYWRAPGDAGIPPLLSLSGSGNVGRAETAWPTPHVFWQNDMRSIGYADGVVVPLTITPRDARRDIPLSGELQIGVCKDVCVPVTLDFSVPLAAAVTRPDPRIAAAIADAPLSAAEAGVRSVRCEVGVAEDGIALEVAIDMPPAGRTEALVIEAGDPDLWVADPDSRRDGPVLWGRTRISHMNGGPVTLDRSQLRITVLGSDYAVDIRRCARG
jgi:DsbC/DsbD-like thiol-disulfide interchange protein